MAAAAMLREQHTNTFDWDFAEAQFATAENERPIESEIYGRSLSTIHRLGAFMIHAAHGEVITSPEAAQAKAEFFTSVEEGFGTDMELGGGLEVRDFDTRLVIDGKVMARDLKTPISVMTEKGLKRAKIDGDMDQRFVPQLTRSHWDHENALIVDKMANGETTYNTRIVISPFPEEAAAESGDEYWRNIGYVPHLRRGFVQLYHTTEAGTLLAGSLSFDGSDKHRLREVFARCGVKIPEGEITDNWLKHAITGDFSEAEAKTFATAIADEAADPKYRKNTNTVDVTRQYRPLLERAFNESYIHICESLARGYQTEGARKLIFELADKAHDFNARYAQTLRRMRASAEQFTDDDSVVLHEMLVYSTIEMMRALHLDEVPIPFAFGDSAQYKGADYLQMADSAQFQSLLSNFGADGARNNHTYSACGLAISLGGDKGGMGGEDSPQSTFGGADSSKEETGDCEFTSKQCPLCKAKNVKTLVRRLPSGQKRISGSCGCSTTTK